MRNNLRLLLLPALAAITGCGDVLGERVIHGRGPVYIENRPVGHFTGVSNSTAAEVEILHSFTEDVFIRAQDNILPYVRTRVRNGVLTIYTDSDVTLRPEYPIIVEVDVVTLRTLESSGRGFMRGQLIDATRLEVNSSGSGDIDLPDLLADSLIILNSGSGDVTAEGQVERLRVNMSAAGGVDTRDLEAFEADVTISGSGSATIRVRDYLRAVLSGSGWLRYFGSPDVEQTVTGTGEVERQGT
ncbi:MAG TPA: head GIN domain-containing protein [Longimicrobiales bacterium]|nr:head GIN domain-containing protein [Longimicrobiales bacterium]